MDARGVEEDGSPRRTQKVDDVFQRQLARFLAFQ